MSRGQKYGYPKDDRDRYTACGAEDGLAELARGRHLALGDQGQIVMAHPFSTVPLGFSVMGARTLWWGGCAWDSFALPLLAWGACAVRRPLRAALSGVGLRRNRNDVTSWRS